MVLDPSDADAWDGRAELWEGLKEYRHASDDLEKAITLSTEPQRIASLRSRLERVRKLLSASAAASSSEGHASGKPRAPSTADASIEGSTDKDSKQPAHANLAEAKDSKAAHRSASPSLPPITAAAGAVMGGGGVQSPAASSAASASPLFAVASAAAAAAPAHARPMVDWSVAEVVQWVSGVGQPYVAYAAAFEQYCLNGAAVLELDDEALIELGVRNRLHRIRLMADAKRAKLSLFAVPPSTPSASSASSPITPTPTAATFSAALPATSAVAVVAASASEAIKQQKHTPSAGDGHVCCCKTCGTALSKPGPSVRLS